MTDTAPMTQPSMQPLTVGMVLFPGFTLLDLAGPQAALGLHERTLLLWKTLEPEATDSGFTINPTTTFDDCPDDLDVLFDFGLTLLAELGGEQTAKITQLAMEYDPAPPFDTGTPDAAAPELTGIALAMRGDANREAVEIARGRRNVTVGA